MIRQMIRPLGLAAVAAAALVSISAPARAADAEASFFTITGFGQLNTDYRFRGVSLSNGDPTVNAGLTIATEPGFYVSTWGSSLATYGGANTEVDLYGGWSKAIGAFTPNIGIYGYLYPGGTGVDYYEIFASLGFALGPVNATVGINYAPSQSHIGGTDNTYIYVAPSFAIPGVPITIKGNLGYEDGAGPLGVGGIKHKVDYMIGADLKWKALTFGVQYIGNDEHSKAFFNKSNLGDTVLASITWGF